MRTRRTLTLATTALALVALAAPASARANPAQNHPGNWETPTTSCTKVEVPDGVATWTLSAPSEGPYALLVIKAGTVNDVIEWPMPGMAYAPSSGKDISHVIVCVFDSTGGDGGGVVNSCVWIAAHRSDLLVGPRAVRVARESRADTVTTAPSGCAATRPAPYAYRWTGGRRAAGAGGSPNPHPRRNSARRGVDHVQLPRRRAGPAPPNGGLTMADRSLRGMRIGANSMESDRASSSRRGSRRTTTARTGTPSCSRSPRRPTCPWCGSAAAGPRPCCATRAPEPKAGKPPRTHWDMLLERRTVTELEDLLTERLELLRAGKLRRSA